MADHDPGAGTLDKKAFFTQFSRVTALAYKKHLLERFLKDNPSVKPLKLVDELDILADKKHCLEYAAGLKGSLHFIENISFSRKFSAIESLIDKEAKKVFRQILEPHRKGRKFPEILLGGLGSLVRKNERGVLEGVMSRLAALKASHPVKRIYGQFIRDMAKAVEIDGKIKNRGLGEETIRTIFNENSEVLSRRGMRMAVQNLFFLDPRYANFHATVQGLLDSLLDDGTGGEQATSLDAGIRKELDELKKIRDLDAFVKKASAIIDAGGHYANEVDKIFNLFINNPLVNIYKLLKFPLNAELFHKWLATVTVANGISSEIERTIASIRHDKPPETGKDASYESLVALFYSLDLNFTDKYNLISALMEKTADRRPFEVALRQIKEVQFKIENKFITAVLGQLGQALSFSEIEVMLAGFKKKIVERIGGFAVNLKKNIEDLIAGENGLRFRPLMSLLGHIAEEKLVSREAFFAVLAEANPEKDLGFAARLANSLIDFYFLLNSKLILGFLEEYFSSIRKTDGIFLKHRMSFFTKEQIYEFMKKYAAQRPVVMKELEKYLQWCGIEKSVRENALARLGAPPSLEGQIVAGLYVVRGIRSGTRLSLQLIDKNGKTRFSRTVSGITTYLDFSNTVKRFRLDRYAPAADRDLKTLYQYIHLQAVSVIEQYIGERLKLLSLKDSLLNKTSQEIGQRAAEYDDPSDYLEGLARQGDNEISLREQLIQSLIQEREAKEAGPETKARCDEEIESNKAAVERIRIMMNFLSKLGLKKSDASLLSIKDIDNFLKLHPAGANAEFLQAKKEEIEAVLGEGTERRKQVDKVRQYLESFPDVEIFSVHDSIYEGRQQSVQETIEAVEQSLIAHTVDENIESLSSLIFAGEEEIEKRRSYIKGKERLRPPESLVYKQELVIQRELVQDIGVLIAYFSKELIQYREIKKLNNEAGDEQARIQSVLESSDPAGRAEVLLSEIKPIRPEEKRLSVAARFFIEAQAENIREKMEQVLNEGTIDRFKILVALYRVLDAQEDHDIKLKLMDEFIRYLAEARPEVYTVLKPLLDIQRERIVTAGSAHRVKMSDFYRVCDALRTREEKIRYVDECLSDPAWELYSGYLSNIKEGLLEENVNEFLRRNNNLSAADQRELIDKMKLYRKTVYNTPQIERRLARKKWELDARFKLLADPAHKVFSASGLKMIADVKAGTKVLADELGSSFTGCERAAVEKELQAHGVPADEIARYLEMEMGESPRILSVKKERKPVRATKREEKKIVPEKSPRKEETLPEPDKADNGILDEQAPAISTPPKEPSGEPAIATLSDALEFFGHVQSDEEKATVREIEKLIAGKKVSEAENRIKKDVVWENTKKKDYGAVARLLGTLSQLETVRAAGHLKAFVETQLESLEKAIKDHAVKMSADSRQLARESPAGSYEKQGPKTTGEEGRQALVRELENIDTITPLSVFAANHGFKEDEVERLQNLCSELKHKGAFIYVDTLGALLGKGKLKGMIERAFNERLNRKPPTVDKKLLKAAWDEIRRSLPIDTQIVMAGAASESELKELGRELEELVKPEGVFGKSDPRKKLAQEKHKEGLEKEIEPRESVSRERREAIPERHRELSRGHVKPQASIPLKKKPMKEQKKDYSATARAYVERSFKPLVSAYIKRLYKAKTDFYIAFQGRRQYFTYDMVENIIESILRKDVSGRRHEELLDSLKHDNKLMPLVISMLFSEYQGKNGQKFFFPRFLKGEIKL